MPTDAARYRFLRAGNSRCSRRDDRPLMNCTSFDGASCGGAATSTCTWSGDTAPLIIVTSRATQICRIKSRARSAMSPRRILYRSWSPKSRDLPGPSPRARYVEGPPSQPPFARVGG